MVTPSKVSSLAALPRRLSLVESVIEVLREQMDAGRWLDLLPGERRLCNELEVSRPTLRLALEALQREGRLTVEQGRRRRILEKPRESAGNPDVIAMLSPLALEALPPFVLFWLDELRTHLAKVGQRLEFQVSSACSVQQPERVLETLVQSSPAALWILLLSTQSVQHWFEARGVPCLVAGSTAPDVRLPSIDIDYRAACRHAVGVFRSRGHERVALVVPVSGSWGDMESENGFFEGCVAGPAPLVIRHDGTREGLLRRLETSMRQRRPPTGFLVARAAHTLTVLSFLLQRGLAVPAQYAVISRDNEPFLDYVTPTVAHYRTDRTLFARRLMRAITQIQQSGQSPARPIRLIPELVMGETV